MPNGARRNWASAVVPDEYMMPHWAGDPAQGLSQQNNNDYWGSGPGGMPVNVPGMGAQGTTPAMVSRLSSSFNPAGIGSGSSIADSLRGIGRNSFFGQNAFSQRHPNFYDQPPSNTSGGGIMKSLGGLGGIFDIGTKIWGLKQKSDEIGNLEDYRENLMQRADAQAALDQERMAMVRDEFGTLKTARKANIWSQRPEDPNANPWTNQLVSQEV